MVYKARQLPQEWQEMILSAPELNDIFNRTMESITQELEREYDRERKKANQERQELYSARKAFLRACLERYRASPEGTPIRDIIDSLVIANRDCSGFSEQIGRAHV